MKSFLDSTTINTEISDEEDMIVDQTYNCVVCLIDLGSKPHLWYIPEYAASSAGGRPAWTISERRGNSRIPLRGSATSAKTN